MNAVAAEQCAETYGETLAERMERGPLPVGEALRYAIQIARYLRDLHAQGLVYGAVSSHLIVLAPSGACLRPSGGVAHLGDRRSRHRTRGTRWLRWRGIANKTLRIFGT